MKIKTIFTSAVLLLILITGCGQEVNTEEPPDIAYGQDVCERCGMIITEEKFAAAYWTENGEARRFDDIGGMLAYQSENQENVAAYWVHDFDSGDWMPAEDAHYLLDSALMTPMGFGIAAFSNMEQAQAFAYGQEDIKIRSFSDLMQMSIIMPGDLYDLSHAEAGHGHD